MYRQNFISKRSLVSGKNSMRLTEVLRLLVNLHMCNNEYLMSWFDTVFMWSPKWLSLWIFHFSSCNKYSVLDRVEEADVITQTDAFLDRPPTPLFVPAKTGLDAATQIQDGDVRTIIHST